MLITIKEDCCLTYMSIFRTFIRFGRKQQQLHLHLVMVSCQVLLFTWGIVLPLAVLPILPVWQRGAASLPSLFCAGVVLLVISIIEDVVREGLVLNGK